MSALVSLMSFANVAYLAITSVINIVLAKNMVASAAPDSNSKFKNIS